MPATWPNTLPTTPLFNDYEETPQDSLLRFGPDAGKAKQRNTTTAMPSDVTEVYILTELEWATLDSFWKVDCNRGGTSMLKVHPPTGLTKEYIFTQPPQHKYIAPNIIRVSLTLELLP